MKISKATIDRYLKGQCTNAEAEAIEKALAENPQDWNHLLPMEDWENQPHNTSYLKEDKILEKINEQLPFYQKRKTVFFKLFKVAALLLAALTGFWFLQQKNTGNIQTALKHNTDTLINSNGANLYFINSGKENMRLVASDGSIITLYPHSEIKYPEDFSQNSERLLHLKGKAMFEVAKDKSKPFRVNSNGMRTTALGTIFMLDELAKAETRVQLIEGIIEVVTKSQNAQRNIVRKIDQQEEITLDHELAKIITRKVLNNQGQKRESLFLQTNNALQFKNLLVKDIVNILEQNYGISIDLHKHNLSDKYFSGSFKDSESVYNNIIQEINYLHGLNLSVTDTKTDILKSVNYD